MAIVCCDGRLFIKNGCNDHSFEKWQKTKIQKLLSACSSIIPCSTCLRMRAQLAGELPPSIERVSYREQGACCTAAMAFLTIPSLGAGLSPIVLAVTASAGLGRVCVSVSPDFLHPSVTALMGSIQRRLHSMRWQGSCPTWFLQGLCPFSPMPVSWCSPCYSPCPLQSVLAFVELIIPTIWVPWLGHPV